MILNVYVDIDFVKFVGNLLLLVIYVQLTEKQLSKNNWLHVNKKKTQLIYFQLTELQLSKNNWLHANKKKQQLQ